MGVLVVSLLTALWSGIAVVRTSQFAFNSVWEIPYHEPGPGWGPRGEPDADATTGVASLPMCDLSTLVDRSGRQALRWVVRQRAEAVGDTTDIVKEPVAFAAERCDLHLEATHLAVCVLSNTARATLSIGETAAGFSVGEAPGLVRALMRCNQNCRDLLPDPVNFADSFVSGRCGSLQVREFPVELNELLLELSEPLIDDRAVVPLPGNWKARRGSPRTQPIAAVEPMT